ncbi:MAG: hypothetical protein R2701_02975 [Acidimicrobiales bacterium]|nr:hypothetical protein [Acidimicrobiales bacterium]
MIDAFLSFTWTWDPGLRGVLTVAVAVTILMGSIYLILATNSGARLGFMLALTGFCAWMFVMGIIWSLYGIGPKGPAPTWKVVDTIRTQPCTGETKDSVPAGCDETVQSELAVAESVPLPSQLPDPVALRDDSAVLTAAFPTNQRDPGLGDLVTVDTALKDDINEQADPWRILETSNKYTGETQAVVAEDLGPDGQAIFESSSDYVVIESFLTGGKKARTDDSIMSRAVYKVTSTLDVAPPPFYAAVQLQQVIPQETKDGQAPPTPERDHQSEVITVVLQRVQGHQLRRPQIVTMIFFGSMTALLCYLLHRRDQLSETQRSAVAGAS